MVRRGQEFGVSWRRVTAFGLSLLATTALSGPALAQVQGQSLAQGQTQEAVVFDIPAQPLPTALTAFAAQSGLQVSVDQSLVTNLRSTPVSGSMAPEAALRRLLEGTGLTWRFTDSRSIFLSKVPEGRSGVTTLPPVAVEGATQRDIPPSYDPVLGYRATQSTALTRAPATIAETPNSISVVTKDVIRDRNAQTLTDMLSNVAGAYAGDAGRGFHETIGLRGFTGTAVPSANLRENYLAVPTPYPADAAIIERFEVIKGPSSIAGGSTEPGGFVNRVLKSPLYESHVQGGASINSFGTARGNVDANWASVGGGMLRGRLVAAVEDGDEFVDHTKERHIALLPSVAAESESTRLTVIGNFYRADGVPYAGTPLFADGSIPDIPRSRNFGGNGTDFDIKHTGVSVQAVHNFLDDLQLNLRGGAARSVNDFTDIYGYGLQPNGDATIYATRRRRDTAGYTGDVFLTKSFQISEASSKQSTFTAGTDLLHFTEDLQLGYQSLGTGNIFNNFNSFSIPADFSFDSPGTFYANDRTAKLQQHGLYAQTVLRPFDPLTLMAGIRYDYADLELKERTTPSVRKDENDAFTVRFGASYEILPGISPYASYAESFKPQPSFVTSSGGFLPAERADQFEVGVKAEVLDRKLLLTGSLFWITRKNVATTDPLNTNFSIAVGELKSEGVELEATGSPWPGLNLTAAFTYVDAEVTKSNNANVPVGARPFRIPKYQANLWATYEIQQGDLKGWGAGLGVFTKSSVFLTQNNSSELEGYTRFDAALFYTGFENFDIRLHVKNLFDRRYIENPGIFNNFAFFGESLSATLTVGAKF